VTQPRDPRAFVANTTSTVNDVPAVSREARKRPGLVQIFPRSLDAPPASWSLSGGAAVIGRGAEADVHIDDASASRSHARVELRDGALHVSDLDSRHGTFVDGSQQRGGARRITPGGVIRIGRSLFMLVADLAAHAAAPERVAGELLGVGHDIVGGPTSSQVWREARALADLTHPVLVLGESGSGKEAVARLVHAHRPKRGPFVAVNVAAIPEGMFESELFGHTKGAFTGAIDHHPGAFRAASGGVLFLDEVGDLRPDLQPKLLRAIDQMRVRPLGAKEEVAVNVRVVAATSHDLQAASARGDFRRDLYYRLAGTVVSVPPLRERRDEIVLLALFTLEQAHHGMQLSAAAAEALVLARWDGNTRQLHHALTHAAVRARSAGAPKILPEHLPPLELAGEPLAAEGPVDAAAIRRALLDNEGNASNAAKRLGISRATLYNILKREGIDPATLRTS
jgi:DNA-binding NtrC family response regulator